MAAINHCRAMVVIFSKSSNSSPQVHREVERAMHRDIILVPFRIEAVIPTSDLEYYLSVPHWLDAYEPPLERHLETLVDTIARLLGPDADAAVESHGRAQAFQPQPVARVSEQPKPAPFGLADPNSDHKAKSSSHSLRIGVIAAIVLTVATVAIRAFPRSRSAENLVVTDSTIGSTIDSLAIIDGRPTNTTATQKKNEGMRPRSVDPASVSGRQNPQAKSGLANLEPVPSATNVARGSKPTSPASASGQSALTAPTTASPNVGAATQPTGTVLAAPPPAALPPSPEAPIGRNLRSEIQDAVSQCVETLRSSNATRMAQLYAPDATPNPATRQKLLQLMQRSESRLSVVGTPAVGAAEIDSGSARADFTVRLKWRTNFGGRESQVRFRVTIVPDRDQSQIACGIVGNAAL
jgi:hypothetical protein